MKIQTTSRRSLFRAILRYIKIMALGFLLIGIAGMIFIKFNTSAAAEITDKYLRPIFGDRQIIFLETVFFNLSDKATKVVYDFKKPLAPQFINSEASSTIPTSLNLQSIPPNPSFPPLVGEGTWHNISLNIFPNKKVLLLH